MRTVRRPRKYVSRPVLTALRPMLRYSASRDAFVLRVVGRKIGPVLRVDRRPRRSQPFEGADRRRSARAA